METAPAQQELPRRKRGTWIRRVAIAACFVVIGGFIFGWLYIRDTIHRSYSFAGYVNAIHTFIDESRPIPNSIEELEQAYNKSEFCRGQLPSPPDYRHPTYRPIPAGVTGGPYLILIEPKPTGFVRWVRMVIYADADGISPELRDVWEWQLDDLIRADDAKRANRRQPASERSATSDR